MLPFSARNLRAVGPHLDRLGPAALWARTATNKAANANFEDDEVDVTPDTHERGTYDELKEACRRSGGDAAREWMSGATSTGSAVYKAAKQTKEEAVETIKRGMEEGISRPEAPVKAPAQPHFPHPADSCGFFTSAAAAAAGEGAGVADKVKESLARAADALEGGVAAAKEKVTGAAGGAAQAVNAHAAWEDSRPPGQRVAHEADRKSQLTDEAYGDNPAEATPRMAKDAVPDPLDTPH